MRLSQILGRQRSTCSGAERGFTLIEALLALFIVSLAVVAVVHASGRILRTQASLERHLEAVTLAEARLNDVVLFPTDSLKFYTEARSGEIALDGRRYRWRALVRQEAEDGRLWRAAVSVEWREGVFDLETVFFRRGDRYLTLAQVP